MWHLVDEPVVVKEETRRGQKMEAERAERQAVIDSGGGDAGGELLNAAEQRTRIGLYRRQVLAQLPDEPLPAEGGLVPSFTGPTAPRPIPIYPKTAVNAVLSRVMVQSGLHQAEVARRMRCRPQSLNQYVRSRRCKPSLDWMLHFLSINGAQLAVVWPTKGPLNALAEPRCEELPTA